MILKGDNNNLKAWYDMSGIVWEQNGGQKITWDVKTPAQALSHAVGVEQMRKLHYTPVWVDVLILVTAFLLLGLIGLGLALLNFGWYTIPLIILQGTVIVNLCYAIRHDICMHRQLGGARMAYFTGALLSLPMLNTYTHFLLHADHHLHVGHDLFEEHIAELDKRWKRWFCLTMPGFIFLFWGKLRSPGEPNPNKNWKRPALFLRAKKIEMSIQRIFIVGMLIATWFWPYALIVGYWIPFTIVVPFLAALKNTLQHSETDIQNPFHVALFYKTNWFLRVFYCYSLGDAHLVHHLFPRIPFYKTGKAARLFHTELIRQGVPERKLGEVLKAYYITGKPYRERWTDGD